MFKLYEVIVFYLVSPDELSFWWGTVAPFSPGATTNNTLMHSSFNTVVHLQVEFWKLVLSIGTCVFQITKWWCVNNVTHNKTLDSLILRNSLSSRSAPIYDINPKRKQGVRGRNWFWNVSIWRMNPDHMSQRNVYDFKY